jgi:uncharacterized membrane protein
MKEGGIPIFFVPFVVLLIVSAIRQNMMDKEIQARIESLEQSNAQLSADFADAKRNIAMLEIYVSNSP